MRRPERMDRERFSNPSGRAWTLKSVHGCDLRHRRSGPAIELDDGAKEWCLYGRRHFWQTASGFYLSGGGSAGEGYTGMSTFPGYERDNS